MSWDPFQRDALEAMGLRLYAVQGAAGAAPAQAETAVVPAPGPAPSRMDAGAADGPLLRALLRACGRGADDAEALALCRSLLAGGGLPDPSARRALWPRLRALRARAPR